MRVAWKRPRLDAELAAGTDPLSTPELALRSEQLADPLHRARVARSLRRAIESAEPAPHRRLGVRGSTIPVSRAAVLEARPTLLALAHDLTELQDPDPMGVALALRLLSDGSGPLYRPWTPPELADAANQARAAL
jgi:hypothetical protein